MAKSKLLTYVSLFSSAGVGCFGFKQAGFACVATVELLKKRLNIQEYNQKCSLESGYIPGDVTKPEVKHKIYDELARWNIGKGGNELDVLIATPPCQGMSVANHKKGDELGRNSLVVESLLLTKDIKPKFFVYENVRAFLTTLCTDTDGVDKPIKEAIELNLGGLYNISYQVINFKHYGSPSSRTRTLVIGTRKDLKEVTPLDLHLELEPEQTLRQTIGHLPALTNMGETWEEDIYHNYRAFNPAMLDWIKDIKEGQSAFDNEDVAKKPHKVVDGEIIVNTNKNGDKYTRQYWDKAAPCIHTRNDILASQSTVHPTDNRVFSIREVMLMMSVPASFQWSKTPYEELNALSPELRKKFLAKEEMNIRHSLGEAVPTVIFYKLATNIKKSLNRTVYSDQAIAKLIAEHGLQDIEKLNRFIENNGGRYPYAVLSKIAELSNTARTENAAYYTRQDICYSLVKDLPDAKKYKELRILEPAVGVGNFLPLLIKKYQSVDKVMLDVVDIDTNSLKTLKTLLQAIEIPANFEINFIQGDFLLHTFSGKYDIVVGNPPFKKVVNEKELLGQYKAQSSNKDTNNLFSFFIEKAVKLGDYVALIVPKSLINTPEFNTTRTLLETCKMDKIIDYGEKGFKGVKIETICFFASTRKKPKESKVEIESYILNSISFKPQDYIFSKEYPYWLIYRNDFFDEVAGKLKFNIFTAFRDRQITKKITKDSGKIRVLKSRNIGSNAIIDIPGYDCYVDAPDTLGVSKYMNREHAVLVPNLTYSPRACFLPTNTITDGSVAILTLRNGGRQVNEQDLAYYNSDEFEKFYAIARNYGTRSLNIDNNSVFFFGIQKDNACTM